MASCGTSVRTIVPHSIPPDIVILPPYSRSNVPPAENLLSIVDENCSDSDIEGDDKDQDDEDQDSDDKDMAVENIYDDLTSPETDISHIENDKDVGDNEIRPYEFDDTPVDRVISHDKGGYIYEDNSDASNNHELNNNLFYPWANEDEFWLSDLLFNNVSSSATDKILGAIATGRLSTRMPIRFKNTREMHAILDQGAEIVKMVRSYFNVYGIL